MGSLSNKEVGKKFDSKWLISNVHHTVEGKIMKIDYFDKQAWWIIAEYIWIQFSTLARKLYSISQSVNVYDNCFTNFDHWNDSKEAWF